MPLQPGVSLVRQNRMDEAAPVLTRWARCGDGKRVAGAARQGESGARLCLAGRPTIRPRARRARSGALAGPYSTRALLASAGAGRLGNYRQALTPWTELHNRICSTPRCRSPTLRAYATASSTPCAGRRVLRIAINSFEQERNGLTPRWHASARANAR